MDVLARWYRRQLASGLILMLTFSCVRPSKAGIADGHREQQTSPAGTSQSLGTASKPAAQTGPPSSSATPADAQARPQDGNQAPLGTAAAPYEKGIGVAASRPAGVVVAPGKQKRERSLLIKVGLIVGAAVAVGTVVGLSSASSSRPH